MSNECLLTDEEIVRVLNEMNRRFKAISVQLENALAIELDNQEHGNNPAQKESNE